VNYSYIVYLHIFTILTKVLKGRNAKWSVVLTRVLLTNQRLKSKHLRTAWLIYQGVFYSRHFLKKWYTYSIEKKIILSPEYKLPTRTCLYKYMCIYAMYVSSPCSCFDVYMWFQMRSSTLYICGIRAML